MLNVNCQVLNVNNKGFTLIEILLSIIIIVVIAGFYIPIYQNFQVRNDLNLAATTVAQTLRRAQVLAQASDGNTTWGVRLETGSITLFKGSNYISRDISYDEFFNMATTIDSSSGIEEIVFAKFTGKPSITGNIILGTISYFIRRYS